MGESGCGESSLSADLLDASPSPLSAYRHQSIPNRSDKWLCWISVVYSGNSLNYLGEGCLRFLVERGLEKGKGEQPVALFNFSTVRSTTTY